MVERYFSKFPRIDYNGIKSLDITKRVDLLNKVKNNAFVFYLYDVPEGQRADQVADAYYGDPYLSWLVYLSNQVMDPYFEWPMSSNQFEDFIVKKYGSVEEAKETIAFYRNNWFGKEDIDVARYDALSEPELKYYNPVFGIRNEVISYTRRSIDWTLNTNRIVKYTGDFAPGFIVGENVEVTMAPSKKGQGTVLLNGSDFVYLQHLSGYHLPTEDVPVSAYSSLRGLKSDTTGVVEAVTVMTSNILPEEEIYWDAIYWYEIEEERNAKNRSIKLLDSKFASQTVQEFKKLMSS